MKFSQQVQDSSLQIPNHPSVLRSLWYSCMTMDGALSSQNSTLSKKVMSHCWCHFHRWETLDFNLNLLQRRPTCPAHVLAREKWSWRQPSVLISFSTYKMLHGTWAKFISKLHKSRGSSHNTITLSTARLLSNKMFKKKKLGDWWLLASWSTTSWTHQAPQGQEEKSTWDESIRWESNSKRSTSWWERDRERQRDTSRVPEEQEEGSSQGQLGRREEEVVWSEWRVLEGQDHQQDQEGLRDSWWCRQKWPWSSKASPWKHPWSFSPWVSLFSAIRCTEEAKLLTEGGRQTDFSRGPSLKKIEVGPPTAKRHAGKQKPKVVDDSQAGLSRKKVVVSYPKLDEEDELDKRARELGLDKVDSDEPQVIESKSSAPAHVRGKQDSESQIEKLGSDALEPRRVSIPLPGSEVQAMTPAYRKMLRKLEDSVELYKLHIKHYHMSPTQFRRRTSMLGLPDSVYEKFEDMYNKCRVCVVLQFHHRRELEFQAYDPPTLEMLSLLIMLKFSWGRTSTWCCLF